jgi:flagellar hook protein FlgE
MVQQPVETQIKNILDCVTSVSIGPNGAITGVTTTKVSYNGETIDKSKVIYLGQLALAVFPNQEGLQQSGSSMFDTGPNSGNALYTTPDSELGGKTKAGYLEMANVELAQEFTDMIKTQRGFQANTRIVTVSDEMLLELVNLKR